MEKDVDKSIRVFIDFLNHSWNAAMPVLRNRDYCSDESSLNDWLQANWEFLVERAILKNGDYLEVYGEGADFNGASSRISDFKALPNFSIEVRQQGDDPITDKLNNEMVFVNDANFVEFVSFREGFYHKEPIFDSVLLDDSGIERVVSINQVVFGLGRVSE